MGSSLQCIKKSEMTLIMWLEPYGMEESRLIQCARESE